MQKHPSLLLLLSLMLAVGPGCAKTTSTAGMKSPRTSDDYTPRTLGQIAADGMNSFSRGPSMRFYDEGDMQMTGDLFPSRVTVVNTGMTRQMPENHREFIRAWATNYAGSMEYYTLPYQTEYAFIEDNVRYWIAVRTQSLPDFEQNFREGEKIDLEVIRLGAVRNNGTWDWVLLVENFNRHE